MSAKSSDAKSVFGENKLYSIFIHTHTDCLDALYMCVGQLDRFLPNVKKYVAINSTDGLSFPTCTLLTYDEKLSYTERLALVLPQISEKIVLYMHEDMILYDQPKEDELNSLETYLLATTTDFVRLISNNPLGFRMGKNLLSIAGDYYFAIQPTLWKKDKLVEFVGDLKLGIWELEMVAQQRCRDIAYGVVYRFGVEQLRGMSHYDSWIFPYTATAIVKGKWNTMEYAKELKQLFMTYGVRGNRQRNG